MLEETLVFIQHATGMTLPPGKSMSAAEAATFRIAAFDTWAEILEGWWNLIFHEFIYCTYNSELDGTNTRYSLLQGAVILFIPFIILQQLFSYIPSFVFAGAGWVLSTFFSVAISIVGLLFWIGFSTGWKVLCSPTFPSIVAATQGMQLLITSPLLNKCPIVGGGLVQQVATGDQLPSPVYTAETCMVCNNWANGVFTIASCRDDLGWTSPLDEPVFWLKACSTTTLFCSGWLAFIQDPANFNFFIASIINIPLVHDWLHRWDNVDLTNPVAHRMQYTCAWIQIIAWFLLISLLAMLLAFGPVLQALKFILALFAILIVAAVMLLFAFFVVLHAMLMTPVILMRRARRLQQKRDDINTIRRLQGKSAV